MPRAEGMPSGPTLPCLLGTTTSGWWTWTQTGPKDCLPQCGNKRLCRRGVTPSISMPGSHMLQAPFCLYAAWLLIERRHAGYSRLFPHWCKGCFGHVWVGSHPASLSWVPAGMVEDLIDTRPQVEVPCPFEAMFGSADVGFPIVLAKFTLLMNYTFFHNEFRRCLGKPSFDAIPGKRRGKGVNSRD